MYCNGIHVAVKENALDINAFLKEIYKDHINGYPKFFKMDTASKLAFTTAEFLINNSKIPSEEKENVAVILSNNSASLDTDRKHQETINNKDSYYPSPAIFVYTLPNIGIGEISIRHTLYGENAFFIFDTFNAKALFEYTLTLTQAKKSNHVICGWVNVDKNNYNAFMYLVSTKGDYEHTIENIYNLYNK